MIGAELLGPVSDPRWDTLDPQDIRHLCQVASRYFRSPITPEDVVWQQATVLARDSLSPLARVSHRGGCALGHLSGRADDHLPSPGRSRGQSGGRTLFGSPPALDASVHLARGRLLDLIDAEQDPVSDLTEFQRRLRQRFPWLDLSLARRWSRQYGVLVLSMLDGVQDRSELGEEVAPDLYDLELRHLVRTEWACTADDVLWRRTKLGLQLSEAQHQAVARWFQRSAPA